MEGFGKYIFRVIVEIKVIYKQLLLDESKRIIVVLDLFGNKICVLVDIKDYLYRWGFYILGGKS